MTDDAFDHIEDMDLDDELGEAPSTTPDEPEAVPEVATDTVEE
jgi:hypothetical protein